MSVIRFTIYKQAHSLNIAGVIVTSHEFAKWHHSFNAGDYYGIGNTRRVELLNACLKLGIFPSQIHQLECFHDNINKFWNIEEIAASVDKFVTLIKAKAVFTFDEGGVSGHRNHISTSKGVR